MRRTSHPADTVVCVVRNTGKTLGRRKQLKPVVIDEDGGGSSLTSVSLHRLLDRLDGRGQDGIQTFLVDGHLDGDVGEGAVNGRVGTRTDGGVVLGVGVVMGDRTKDHSEVLHDLEGEKEGYTPEGRSYRGKSEAYKCTVQQPLLKQGTNTVADKDCVVGLETFPRLVGKRHLHRLSPAARPLYTQAYNTVGRGIGAHGSTSMVYFLPYQVRFVFFLATKTPVSGSPERGVGPVSVGPGLGAWGKIPKTELYRETVVVWNGLRWEEWPETEFEPEPVPSALDTGGRDRHKSLMRRSSKS